MKKNLIGAVAAGLALALAFTGCESGSDTPLELANYTAATVAEKKSYDYVAKASSYTDRGIINDVKDKEFAGGMMLGVSYGKGHWVWNSYEKGENKWNRDVDADVTDTNSTYYNRYTTNRGKPDGKTVGDVIKTSKSTVTLSYDGTYKVVDETTNKEVYRVSYYDYKVADVPGQTYKRWDGEADVYNYDSTLRAPFKVVKSDDTTVSIPAFAVSGTSVTRGVVYYGASTTSHSVVQYATEADALNACELLLKNAVKAQETVLAQAKDKAHTNEVYNAKITLKTLKDYYDAARALREGATYAVLEEKTVDLVKNGTVTYYTKAGGDVVRKVETKDDDSARVLASVYAALPGVQIQGPNFWYERTGTFKLLSGTFQTGKILITSVKYKTNTNYADVAVTDITFHDDTSDQSKSYYIDASTGSDSDRGLVTRDYPAASKTTLGNAFQYDARVYTITNGVLTSPIYRVSMIPDTNDYFATRSANLGFQYQTYADAVADRRSSDTANRQWADEHKKVVEYTK